MSGYIFGALGGTVVTQITQMLPGTTILAADGIANIPAGTYVGNLSIKNDTDTYLLNVGTTPGGNEIADQEEITAGITRDLHINTTFDVATTLYFTGIPSQTIIIYRR